MKKYTLFPTLSLPKAIVNFLAYFVIGLGLLVLVTGIVVKDNLPASAQDTLPSAVVSEPAAEDAPTAPVPAPVTDDAGRSVDQPSADKPAESTTHTTAELAEEPASPSRDMAAQIVSTILNVDLETASQATAATSPEHLTEAAPEPSPAAYFRDQAAARGQMQALIDIKKAEDTTSFGGRIMSIIGIFAFLGISWLMSNNRKKILWRLVAVGTLLQLCFAIFILWTPVGKAIFAALNNGVTVLLDFTKAGSEFLFASYVSGTIESANVHTAMSILPPIIFFSALMTVLYHLGIMQWIVRGLASFMMRFMGTSGSETLSAVSNIFVGQTEAPLVVKPYVAKMTKSELFAVMTGGFATVAGGVMASYVAMLQPYFPDIAGHMIAASVMSAPATLVIAKMMYPETEESETMGKYKLDDKKQDANAIDAAARGASEGMQLAINVAAMLVAFIAIIALINFCLGFPSRVFNATTYDHVAAYAVSSGETLDPDCSKPYASSDTIACTHKGLMTIAKAHHIELDTTITQLAPTQSAQIDQVKAAYAEMIPKLGSPLAHTPMLNDCRDKHSIAACGAVIATTQSKSWTPSLQPKNILPLLSLEYILGWLFFPIAFLMGVPLQDCFLVGQLLGEKMGVNEFVAYLHLAHIVDQLSYRGIVISTYALCGFANFGSIAIQIGGIGGMAPARRSDLAKMGIKAMIAGSIAAFMTATIAGALI